MENTSLALSNPDSGTSLKKEDKMDNSDWIV